MATRNRSVPLGPSSVVDGDVQFVLVNLAALAIAGFVAFSLIIWDFICYLLTEIRLLKDFWQVELWRIPDSWAFLLSRYSAFAFSVASLFTLSLKTEHCQLATSLTQILSIFVVASSGALVARRTVTMWASDSAVTTLLVTVYALMVASWVATATQHRSRSSPVPLPMFGTNCALQTLPPWSPINYAASTIFFTLALCLSICRIVTQRTDRSLNIGITPMNRGYISYALVNALTSLALFVVSVTWHRDWTTAVAKRTAAPFFVFLVGAMNQRLYINNQADTAVRRKGLEEVTSATPPSGKANRMPRWSFVPIYRKPVPPVGEFDAVGQTYPRPPLPPRTLPTSPIPPQHIAWLERSRKASSASSATSESSAESELEFKSPPGPNAKLPTRTSNGRVDSSPTSPPMSPSSAGVGSPMTVVSTMGFGSPPGSPAVLSLPWPGKQRKKTWDGGRASLGSVWTSGSGSQPGTPMQGPKRLLTFKSGWVA